jgi:hypothetical protein
MSCIQNTRRYRVRTAPHYRQAVGRGGGAVSVRGLAPRGLVACLASAGRVVLFHHAGGYAPALAHRQAVLFGPGPDVTRALAVSRGPPGAARLRPPGPAGMLNIGRELPAELGGVLAVQVNLIVRALEREPVSFLGRAACQVVRKDDGYFLGTSLPSRCQGCFTVP